MALTQITKGMLGAKSVDNQAIDDLAVGTGQIAAGALSADTAGRAKMADGFMTQAKMGAGVYSTGGPCFSVYLGSTQTVSSGVYTKLSLNTELFDTDNCWDTALFRFTPNVAGYYFFTAKGATNSSTSASIDVLSIYKNGTQNLIGPSSYSTSTNGLACAVSGLIYMNGTTDYIEFWGYNGGSGTDTFIAGQAQTWAMGHLVRAG